MIIFKYSPSLSLSLSLSLSHTHTHTLNPRSCCSLRCTLLSLSFGEVFTTRRRLRLQIVTLLGQGRSAQVCFLLFSSHSLSLFPCVFLCPHCGRGFTLYNAILRRRTLPARHSHPILSDHCEIVLHVHFWFASKAFVCSFVR